MGAEKPKKKSKKIVRTEDKNHWRERERKENESKTQVGKIAAGKESCYLLPAPHFLAVWERVTHAGTLIQFCSLYGAARIDVN